MATVKFTLDQNEVSGTSQGDLDKFDAVRDEDIDCSDIPELTEEFWANAKILPPKTKSNVSLRVSEEVIDFFKADRPKGYTGRMAAVLSAYVQAHRSN